MPHNSEQMSKFGLVIFSMHERSKSSAGSSYWCPWEEVDDLAVLSNTNATKEGIILEFDIVYQCMALLEEKNEQLLTVIAKLSKSER